MTIPILHNDIPASLRHILEVTNLVRRKAYDRVDATNFVAKRHSICRTTVADKYTRQLGLSTNDFDRLLEDPDFQKLKKILREKFYDFRDIIDQVL